MPPGAGGQWGTPDSVVPVSRLDGSLSPGSPQSQNLVLPHPHSSCGNGEEIGLPQTAFSPGSLGGPRPPLSPRGVHRPLRPAPLLLAGSTRPAVAVCPLSSPVRWASGRDCACLAPLHPAHSRCFNCFSLSALPLEPMFPEGGAELILLPSDGPQHILSTWHIVGAQ